ncbi:phage minor structural protein [Evansella vedderi]|uniref:Phage minor structural protein n=1 Tax=Evansella vedderi TaxID=38282 RepID=A0ABT9ZVN8_9BACI|nr:phage tail spike protein [Evansella vedderi]MDQ0254934.1 phage minor structural protein [Evansella vedderi]
MIHITDGQNDRILDVITVKHILSNKHRKSLKDKLETFDFTTFADKDFSQHIGKNNRVIIPSEDQGYNEFVITEAKKYRDVFGVLKTEAYASASYILLKKEKTIKPQTLEDQTVSTAVSHAIGDTEWQAGTVTAAGTRTFNIERPTDPFAFLKRIAQEFSLELNFRVEIDGNRILGRYVDLLPRVGAWQGREVEFGRDLIGIKRTEKTDNLYTALLGLGPIREDGTRLEVLVEDQEALARWGRNGQHLIGTYEPQTTDLNMSLDRLTTLTENELEKRVNAVVEYEGDIADLENVPGMENKKIRFGDTIKIKDTKFNPPLYLEARIHTQERDIVDKSNKHVELGDFIEYTEEEVRAIWQTLQAEIAKKISMTDVLEVTYTKQVIDEKDQSVFEDSTYYADVVALSAEERAIEAAEQHTVNYAVSREVYDAKVTEIMNDLAEKAGLEYVDGQLQLKADSSVVNSISDTVDGLSNTTDNLLQRVADNEDELAAHDGRITTVTQEIDTIEGRLNITIDELSTLDGTVQNQQVQIDANASAISLKASQDDLDTVTGDISSIYAELDVQAGQIALKAEQSSLENLEDDVTSVSNQVSSLTVDVDGISTSVTSLQGEFNNLQIGGRNLLKDTSDEFRTANHYTWYATVDRMPISDLGLKPGDIVTFSVYVHPPEDFGIVARFRFEDSDNVNIANSYGTSVEGGEEGLIHVTAAIPQNTHWIRLALNNSPSGTSFSSEYKEAKLERGHRATDWTPAPEDIDSEFSLVRQDISTVDQKADGILSTVQTLEADIDEEFTTVYSSISSVDQKADSINSTVTSLSTTVDGHRTDITEAFSQIEQNANAITQRVTKTEFDNLQIGGRNLAVDTGNPNKLILHRISGSSEVINDANSPSGKTLKIAINQMHSDFNDVFYITTAGLVGSRLIQGEEYIYTFMAKASKNIRLRLRSMNQASIISGFDADLTTEYKMVTFRFRPTVAPGSALNHNTHFILPNMDGANTEIYVRPIKIEKGNRTTDWTPAPEDVDGAIDGIGSRLSTAESTITQHADEIDLRVKENGVIAAINLSPETILMDADRIEFTGHVFGEGATFKGTIDGGRFLTSGTEGNVTIQNDTIQQVKSQNLNVIGGWERRVKVTSGVFELAYEQNLGGSSTYIETAIIDGDSFGITASAGVGGMRLSRSYLSFFSGGAGQIEGGAFLLNDDLHLYATGEILFDNNVRFKEKIVSNVVIQDGNWLYTGAVDVAPDGGNHLYTRTSSSGELRVTVTGTTDNYRAIRAAGIITGYTNLYLSASGEVRVVSDDRDTWGNQNYRPIRASTFPTGTSLRENKTDIEVFEEDALSVIKSSHAYLYKLKGHEDEPHKQLGLMVDETPSILHGEAGDSMEMYALSTYLWRGVQQLSCITDKHSNELEWLKIENQHLRARVKELEQKIA